MIKSSRTCKWLLIWISYDNRILRVQCDRSLRDLNFGLKVIPIPTHRDVKRKDFPDLVYKNQYLKWQAIANECIKMNEIDRPVLIGTTTIEKSELLAALLSEYNVPYRLLNARPENIESEAAKKISEWLLMDVDR